MSAIVLAGERGVDVSFARPPAERLLALGYTFVVGYFAVPPASPKKIMTGPEAWAYRDAGLKVLPVWEMTASRANLGAVKGAPDGRDARRLAMDSWGMPTDVPILFADDTNATPANISMQTQYMQAARENTVEYENGGYGDTDIMEACPWWVIKWLPNAWSWSGGSREAAELKARALGAHVLQHTGFYIDNTWAVDPNTAIRDFPAWGQVPAPQPNPGVTDMADTYFSVETLPGEYLLRAGCDPVPFASAADRDALALGLQMVSAGHLTYEQYTRLFKKPESITVNIPPIQVPPYPTKFTGTFT